MTSTSKNRLPLHTRLGTYATVVIIFILCVFMLRNCATALYYGAVTSDSDVTHWYQAGFEDGFHQDEKSIGGQGESMSNPILIKMYRKGFREGSDSKRNTFKKEKNEKK